MDGVQAFTTLFYYSLLLASTLLIVNPQLMMSAVRL